MTYRYFAKYPTLAYNDVTLTDVTRRIKLFSLVKNQAVGFEKYHVKENETIEAVSFKFYGDSGYHWIIMLVNDILDPYYGWPLSDSELKDHVTHKYGAGNENATHHYKPSQFSDLPPDTILDESVDPSERTAVTNFEHETEVNEAKRAIRILRKEFIQLVVREFQNKIVE